MSNLFCLELFTQDFKLHSLFDTHLGVWTKWYHDYHRRIWIVINKRRKNTLERWSRIGMYLIHKLCLYFILIGQLWLQNGSESFRNVFENGLSWMMPMAWPKGVRWGKGSIGQSGIFISEVYMRPFFFESLNLFINPCSHFISDWRLVLI